MNELQQLPGFLARQMAYHPRLSLTYLHVWLRPLNYDALEEYYQFHDTPESNVLYMLSVAEQLDDNAFHRLLTTLRTQPKYSHMIQVFGTILLEYFPCLDPDFFSRSHFSFYSFPFRSYHYDPCQPRGLSTLSVSARCLLTELGLTPVASMQTGHLILPQDSPQIFPREPWTRFCLQNAVALRDELLTCIGETNGQPFADLACLLMRLFMISHNPLIDYKPDEVYERVFQGVDWDPSGLEFTNRLSGIAFLIDNASTRALDYLNSHPNWRTAFIERFHSSMKGDIPLHGRSLWPELDDRTGDADAGHRRTAEADLTVQYLRDHASEIR